MVKSKIIGLGAEAVVTLNSDKTVSKVRPVKGYRIFQIDDKIRKLRTRAEGRLMLRASKIVNAPTVFSVDEKNHKLVMSFVDGEKLSDFLTSSGVDNAKSICFVLGKEVSKLHDSNIVHGDLTSSNIIVPNGGKEVFFIDFGLSFYSEKFEDKAVDVHLFKEALEAKHYDRFDSLYESFLKGYSSSKNFNKVIDQLSKVEARGRYRH
ncbi:MAG: KEOPS complex kinase/ATPase Bud32 [Nanoarchaeota archaeon]